MKLRNLFLILLAQTLGWTGISAQSIDAEDAAARARDFFQRQQSTTVGVHKAQAMVKPVLAYTATTANTPDFYVFNRAEDLPGFVIVNADATSDTQILGYCESSTFDYETAPDNFKWWLEQYQTNGVAKAPAKAAGIRHDVDYLCKTKWNQDSPYWNTIPYYGETPYVTGCAATSMAQVMKFYEYPDKGVGDHSYVSESLGNRFYANFANTTYDWANMLEDYSKGYSTQQANAVATLMYHCGVAQDMDYNSAGAGGSGAIPGHNGQAMIEHFKYDKSMLYAARMYYTDEAWEELIYGEVSNNRPVLYDGQSTGGGHSFICDGYRSSDQTYHFNWGWGGYCDGNYALTGNGALAPNGSGIGGSTTSDGYTGSQGALVNIKKDEGGAYVIALAAKDEMKLWEPGGSVVTYITNYNLDLRNGGKTLYYQYTPCSQTLFKVTFVAGLELRHKVTGQCTYVSGNTQGSLQVGYFYEKPWEMSFVTSDVNLCNGVYELRPAFLVDGQWHTGGYDASKTPLTITVIGGDDPVDVDVPLTISATQVMVGKSVKITHGDYYTGHVTYESDNPEIATVSENGVVTGVTLGQTTITAKAEAVTGFLETVKTFNVTVVSRIYRDVDVRLDQNNLKVGETAKISITASYDGETSYTVTPEGVVSVSDEGLVTALAEGDAIITVNIAGNGDFRPSTHKLEVTVSQLPPLPAEPGLCMDNYPWVAKDNIATSSDLTLHIPLYNSSSSAINPVKFYVRMYCDGGFVTWTCGYNNYNYPAGGHDDYILDPIEHGFQKHFTPGKVYTYEFYLDGGCTKPMNVPSLTYYYCPDNPNIATAAQLINGTKNENNATRGLVKSLVSKILQK